MDVKLFVIHQSTLLTEYHWLDVGQVCQRVNKFQLSHLQYIVNLNRYSMKYVKYVSFVVMYY